MLSTIRSSNSIPLSAYSSATRRATCRNKPSENFMMLALCTAVTLCRSLARAWSKANRTMRSVAKTEMGLIEIPESGRMRAPVRSATKSISSAVPGRPCSNSMPAYRSSVFSRTTTRSVPGYRLRAPS